MQKVYPQISVAWRMLYENKLRFFISIVGIGVSIALIFVNRGFQDGLIQQMKAYVLGSGADIYVSQEGVDSFLFGSSAINQDIKQNILRVNGVDKVTDVVTAVTIFEHEGEKSPITIIGYDTSADVGGPWKLREGSYLASTAPYQRLYAEKDTVAPVLLRSQIQPKSVVFDYTLAQTYGLSVGDTVEIQDYTFIISGLSAETTSWITSPVFMHKDDARVALKMPTSDSSFFLVTAKEGENIEQIKNNILLRSADPNRISGRLSGIEVFTAAELAQKDADFTEELFVSMIGIITMLTFLIGVLIIGLVVYILTLEKTRDFAVLKALGTTNTQVLQIVFLQTMMSGMLGLLLGSVIAKILEYFTTTVWATQFVIIVRNEYMLTVFFVVIVFSIIAAIIPIRRVLSVSPTLVFSSRQY